VNIQGYVFLVRPSGNAPIVIPIVGEVFFPIFSTIEKLESFFGACGTDISGCQQRRVDDPDLFLESIAKLPAPIRIIADVRFTEEDRFRFTEIIEAN
jgi:hypothetical protein